jgi:hypothetical protein
LVAGGCRKLCQESSGIVDAEMYDPETNTWKKVADLPFGIKRYPEDKTKTSIPYRTDNA